MMLEFRIASNATDDKAPTEFWAIGPKRKDALTALEDVEYIMNLEKKVATLTEALENIIQSSTHPLAVQTIALTALAAVRTDESAKEKK